MKIYDPRSFVLRHNLTITTPDTLAFVDFNDPPEKFPDAKIVVVYWMESVVEEIDKFVCKLKKKYNNDNILLIVSGALTAEIFDLPSNVMIHPAWLDQVIQFNDADLLTRLNTNNTDKSYLFDCLLGDPKDHRLFLFNKIQNSTYKQKFLYNINLPDFASQDVLHLEIPEIQAIKQNKKFNSMIRLPTYQNAFISQLIPTDIYKNSWFTIVAETLSNSSIFPSEKTFKPILSSRVFLHIGEKKFLKFLNSIGFKTFCPIINEDYDLLDTAQERFDAVWNEIEKLCSHDPNSVHQHATDIINYNFNLALNANYWNTRIQDFLNRHI